MLHSPCAAFVILSWRINVIFYAKLFTETLNQHSPDGSTPLTTKGLPARRNFLVLRNFSAVPAIAFGDGWEVGSEGWVEGYEVIGFGRAVM